MQSFLAEESRQRMGMLSGCKRSSTIMNSHVDPNKDKVFRAGILFNDVEN